MSKHKIRQLYLPFYEGQQRKCNCGSCKTCHEHDRRSRYRLRKFLGINKTNQRYDDRELEKRLEEKFRREGWN